MTEKQKKLAIIAGVIVVALFLLLSRKASGSTIINQQGLSPINVTIPGLTMPERDGIAINIPGLPSATPYDYNALSPCMCNGSQTSPIPANTLSLTYVTNEGNMGPNIYNYQSPTDLWHDGINGDAVAAGCVKGTPCYYGYGG